MKTFDAIQLDNITELDVKLAQDKEGLSIPHACPICGGSSIDEVQKAGVRSLTKTAHCGDCDHEWEEIYELVQIRRVA